MDQDFHYYGTSCAAEKGGFSKDEAALIAKAANFVDFLSNNSYAAYWKLVSNVSKSSNYDVVAEMDNPRYTFQGTFSSGFSPEDGLWCSFHFIPGNYDEPAGTPSREIVHGQNVANFLSPFMKRDTNGGKNILCDSKYYTSSQIENYKNDLKYGHMLNRPQSALSREIIRDAILCASNDDHLKSILKYAKGGQYILDNNGEDNLRRFKLILLGVRAHVIADTWAHQDYCGLSNVLNTYWDVNYDPNSWNPLHWGYGRQSIDYNDGTSGWKNKVLSLSYMTSNPNFIAVPNGTSYLGHGWMGHLPDFSFLKYKYKPCWADPAKGAIERNNLEEYKKAWVELTSLFSQAKGNGQLNIDAEFEKDLNKAINAIKEPCNLEGDVNGRKSSADAWRKYYNGSAPEINVNEEPDKRAVLDGMVEETTHVDRYGNDFVNINSDLYLFQIAADYHFHFVKNYLEKHNIFKFKGSWSQQESALSPEVSSLFNDSISIHKTALAGSGGQSFDDIPSDAQNIKPITQIAIHSGNIVDQLAVTYGDTTKSHGSTGGAKDVIKLNNGEHITEVSGHTGSWFGATHVLSLTFKTNTGKTYGPFGNMNYATNKTPFAFKANNNEAVVGFYGSVATHSDGLTALGSIGLGIADYKLLESTVESIS